MTTLRFCMVSTIVFSMLCACAGAAIAQTGAAASPGVRPPLAVPSIGRSYSLGVAAIASDAPPRPLPAQVAGDADDPAYAAYKIAYESILEERWDEARKALTELTKKYPDSEYRDDAEYWIAYSYRQTDRDRAMDLYKKFVKDYKTSSYFDDALADMDQLMARAMAVTLPRRAAGVNLAAPPDTRAPVSPDAPVSAVGTTSYASPALAPVMKMRHLERMLRRGTPLPGLGWTYDDSDLDEATRLRLETVRAIGMTGEDEKGFTSLKQLALNPKEKQVVRIAAIEALSEYRRHESLPILVEIARDDTSEEMQLFAIDYIGQAARDKEKAFDALRTLYASLPPEKVEKRKMVFYAIGGLGNDKAVDFLATVARSNDDYELRREAIYYLGTIGGEKARDVLFEVLEKKPSR